MGRKTTLLTTYNDVQKPMIKGVYDVASVNDVVSVNTVNNVNKENKTKTNKHFDQDAKT